MSKTGTTTEEEPTLEGLHERMDEMSDELETLAEDQEGMPKMVIVAVNGSLDMAYPTLILSGLAAQMGWDVTVFATFWALDMLHDERSRNLKLSALGNPGMPMPNALAVLPGGDRLATYMMQRKMDEQDVESVRELIDRAMDAGVDFEACQMTAELMEYDEDAFIDGVTTGAGAGGALMNMSDADIQMVI
jgi:peroxiredoxin family protein